MALLHSRGHVAAQACGFRSYDRGSPPRQERLRRIGEGLGERLAGRLARGARKPDLWFTYHLYHKAPDHLGPLVSRRLNVPYMVAEASVAPKRATGGWAIGHAACVAGVRSADLVLAMTRIDHAGLEALVPPERLLLFPPFLDTAALETAKRARTQHRPAIAERHGLQSDKPWLLCVAMMRPDAKRESYRLLAAALALLRNHAWHLLVAGDGEAAGEVRHLFGSCTGRVTFLGALTEEELPGLYAACDLYCWPAVDEAYGMALLESQAAGLPVIAGREGGVADVVMDGVGGRLVPRRDVAAFAAALAELLDNSALRTRLGRDGQRRILAEHGLVAAAQRLDEAIRWACRNHAIRTGRG
jgi:glycosyltransferase involved in cell wall biosynthesis